MSVNNCLLIIRHDNRVLMIDADTNFLMDDFGKFDTIEQAIDKAHKIIREEKVKYKIIFRDQ